MKKKIVAICLVVTMTLCIAQAVYAQEIGVKLIGQKEDMVHPPVSENNVLLFPITQILQFLDPSGSETVEWQHTTTPYSLVSFQGQCFKITSGQKEVQEYEFDESGACINSTGEIYQLEVSPRFLDFYDLGIFVPLSFISDILVNSKYGDKFETRYTDEGNLEFTMYTMSESGSKQIINPVTLAMKINSPWLLTEDDGNLFDDADHSVSPIIKGGSTLLPIAPIIEKMGGKVSWNTKERKVSITLNNDTIELWIDKKTANVNGVTKTLEVPPSVIKGRTMVPVRFVTENLGAKVAWDNRTQIVIIYYGGSEQKETDSFVYDYKIALLNSYQKQEDNRKSLADALEDVQKEHDKIQYNDTDPLDYNGKLIHVGDTVGKGTFSGKVKEIRGTQVLVYWNHASFLVDKCKEKETAQLFGINWLTNQWEDAKYVVIENSAY